MVYFLARMLWRIFLTVVGRWKIQGKGNLPAVGGVIIASNHCSYLDPIIVGCSFDRKVSYLAKEELFSNPLIAWFIRQMGAFPVKRGSGDRGAIRESIRLLTTGHAFGIFPEGTRSPDGKLQAGKPGAAMLAVKAKVPIVPVGIIGSKQCRNIRVNIGQPMYFPDLWEEKVSKETLEEITGRIMLEIAQLTE
ncbi:MAG: lysophospholipid acyltransferase family protein [Carboxydocellales bacterium]